MEDKQKIHCNWCDKLTYDYVYSFFALIPPSPLMEDLKETYGGDDFWRWEIDNEVTEDDRRNLNKINEYDQFLNTFSRGYVCIECIEREEKLLIKYNYIKTDKNEKNKIL